MKEDEPALVSVSRSDEGAYTLGWTKLYPVLAEYENVVSCSEYYEIFAKMIKDMVKAYNYSREDAMLVLKDLFYKTYLQLQREEK